ncbi:cupin domain-containing protein [Sphingosinicellaceae bacterium]|nr:cupin domain-containing protein [Sphingosinicellaceae bacterium]
MRIPVFRREPGAPVSAMARALVALPASVSAVLVLLAAGQIAPREERVTPLAAHALPGGSGKRFTAVEVLFPPGARAAPHRHGSAFLYAYVLEGEVRSQIEGERLQTYHTGESWIEQPGAHHLLTENNSADRPARLLVTFVSQGSEPLKIPDAPPRGDAR